MGRRSAFNWRVVLTLTLILAVVFSLPLTSFGQLNQAPDSQQVKGGSNGVEKDNPFERLEWQKRQFGTQSPAYRNRVLDEAQKHNQRLGRNPATGAIVEGTAGQPAAPAWVNIGPTGAEFEQNGSFTGLVRDSGRLRTILVHPTDPNIVYVLTSAGGLWKTTNFEATNTTWTPLTDFLPTGFGGAAAFGRTANTIYLGLGDPYDQVSVGGGMVKSTDGGTTWSAMVNLGNTYSVRDVGVDTTTSNDIVLVATDGGLWRSTNGGTTYAEVTNNQFTGQFIWSLARTSAGWVMATQETQPIANGSCTILARWCTGLGHVYLSTDQGATWVEQTSGISGIGRTTLAVGVPGDAVIYAFAAVPSTSGSAALNTKDLYRSSDGGKTWVALGVNSTKAPTNPQPSYATSLNVMRNQAWYNQTIVVDPTDTNRNTVYLGGTYYAAKTTDGGTSWRVVSEWLPGWAVANGLPAMPYVHADMHAAAVKTTGTKAVLLGTDGGIFVSKDDGSTWSSDKNNGLVTHMFYTLTGSPFFPNFVMGGLQDNGTRVRVDNTGIFNQSLGGDGFGVAMSQANSEASIQSVYTLQMRRGNTKMPPRNYSEMEDSIPYPGMPDGGFYTPVVAPSAIADSTGKYFFSNGAFNIYYTKDGGLSWITMATSGTTVGLTSNPTFRDSPFGLGISPANLKHIAIGANGGRVFVSLDGGVTFTQTLATDVVQGWPGFVSNVTWGNDTTIYATSTAQSEGLYTGVETVRIVKSTDQGATWSAAGSKATGLPDVPVTRVWVDPKDATANTVYAATHVGVYATTDGGASWAPYGTGLPNVRVNDIYMPPDGGFIRIATYGRGIWQLSQLDLVSVSLTDDAVSCEHDGLLGNNESGHLNVVLKNASASAFTGGEVTVTSSNPTLTFPSTGTVSVATTAAGATATASIPVKVVGAVGMQTADLTINYGSGSAMVTVTRPINYNYDDKAAGSVIVNFESLKHGWTVSSATSPAPGDNFVWERRELTPNLHIFGVTDANAPQDTSLVSPTLKIGAAPASFNFNHRWSFEADGGGNYDGGVIEISIDGGTSWSQLATTAYNGAILNGPATAFVGKNAGWPASVNSSVDLGTTYAGKDVKIRFRATADTNTGRQGWEIWDMAFTGLTNTPFGAITTHNEACSSTVTLTSDVNPSVSPDQVAFTATVAGGITPVTGVVDFKDGSTVLPGGADVALVNGVAKFTTTTPLSVGTHYIVAAYKGDSGHAVTNSAQYKQTVLAVPRITLTPATVDFGDLNTGSTSSVMTSVLKNTGSGSLTISNITVAGAGFTATNNCSTTLAVNATCTISVTFHPVDVQGARTGTVTIASDAYSSANTVLNLKGNATRRFASLSKTAVSYANTLVGTTTAAQGVVVTNSGNLPLTMGAVTVSGDYAETDNCNAVVLAPNASCTVNVSFTPTAISTRAGTLTIANDAADSPQTVALSGKGEHLQISGTTSQTVSVQTKATYPLTLKASTGFSGPVTLTCSGAPAKTTCAFDNATPSLAASGTAAVTVTVNPAPVTASAAPVGQTFFAAFGLLGLLLLPLTRKASGRKVLSVVLLAVVITISVGGMVACGSSSSTPAPPPAPTTTFATPGTYALTVTASSGSTVLQTQTLTLTLQ